MQGSSLSGSLYPQVQIKEETRLVSIIDQIDKAVAVIPRGALFKTPFGPIHVNRTFEGELGWGWEADVPGSHGCVSSGKVWHWTGRGVPEDAGAAGVSLRTLGRQGCPRGCWGGRGGLWARSRL